MAKPSPRRPQTPRASLLSSRRRCRRRSRPFLGGKAGRGHLQHQTRSRFPFQPNSPRLERAGSPESTSPPSSRRSPRTRRPNPPRWGRGPWRRQRPPRAPASRSNPSRRTPPAASSPKDPLSPTPAFGLSQSGRYRRSQNTSRRPLVFDHQGRHKSGQLRDPEPMRSIRTVRRWLRARTPHSTTPMSPVLRQLCRQLPNPQAPSHRRALPGGPRGSFGSNQASGHRPHLVGA